MNRSYFKLITIIECGCGGVAVPMEVRGQLGAGVLLPCLLGFGRCSSGCQADAASAFTCWAILLALYHMLIFLLLCTGTGLLTMWGYSESIHCEHLSTFRKTKHLDSVMNHWVVCPCSPLPHSSFQSIYWNFRFQNFRMWLIWRQDLLRVDQAKGRLQGWDFSVKR